MSRLTFSSGDKIEECVLGATVGLYHKPLPVDTEILQIGVRDKKVVLFYITKNDSYPIKEKTFLLHPSNVPLPKDNFKYYFYVGTIIANGWHLFEMV